MRERVLRAEAPRGEKTTDFRKPQAVQYTPALASKLGWRERQEPDNHGASQFQLSCSPPGLCPPESFRNTVSEWTECFISSLPYCQLKLTLLPLWIHPGWSSLPSFLPVISLLTVLARENLRNWCICHLDSHMQSYKSRSNFPTTLLPSCHYTAQWILMALLGLQNPHQILKLALPSLSLPCQASILTHPIPGSLASALPSAYHIHSLVLLLFFASPLFLSECLIPSPFCASQTCLAFETRHKLHNLHETFPKTGATANPLFLFPTSCSSWGEFGTGSMSLSWGHVTLHHNRSSTFVMPWHLSKGFRSYLWTGLMSH